MKHIPILFSTAMVQAILEGRKKMTRRICKHQYWSHSELVDVNINKVTTKVDKNVSCKFGNIGDILWVRESFCLTQPYSPEDYYFGYKYGFHSTHKASEKYEYSSPDIWRPSIHMPKEACRIFLRVTDIRCERLHEISQQDAVDEGISHSHERFTDYMRDGGYFVNPINSFRSLWASINGQQSWDDNPYVWVISFERCDRPADFLNIKH